MSRVCIGIFKKPKGDGIFSARVNAILQYRKLWGEKRVGISTLGDRDVLPRHLNVSITTFFNSIYYTILQRPNLNKLSQFVSEVGCIFYV